ncbi:hypothetical protein IWX90DRAFT_319919 [Phyllosticta citrichinensis]|uniref:Uncharacterized protein n=1 Tax=Phyllosticta citrichinensis TaxID=1130410 RepID=A0ABR1XJH7_9PEZI
MSALQCCDGVWARWWRAWNGKEASAVACRLGQVVGSPRCTKRRLRFAAATRLRDRSRRPALALALVSFVFERFANVCPPLQERLEVREQTVAWIVYTQYLLTGVALQLATEARWKRRQGNSGRVLRVCKSKLDVYIYACLQGCATPPARPVREPASQPASRFVLFQPLSARLARDDSIAPRRRGRLRQWRSRSVAV